MSRFWRHEDDEAAPAPAAFYDILNQSDDDEDASDVEAEILFMVDAEFAEGQQDISLYRDTEDEERLESEESAPPVVLSTIYDSNGEVLYQMSPTVSRVSSRAARRSSSSSSCISSGAISPITIASGGHRSPSPVPTDNSSIASEQVVVTVGHDRGRGGGSGRTRGGGRGRGGGCAGIHGAWQRGDLITETHVTDSDVPADLQATILDDIAKRQARKRKRTAQALEDDEFHDAEDGDAALFPGDESAVHFEWRTMDTFASQRESFVPRKTGPTTAHKTALDAFSQFWGRDILEHIVTETNRYATTKAWADWYDTNCHEILVLFAFWMMLGIIKMPSIKSCFSTNYLMSTNCFRLMFSRQRYERLCSTLHFNNNDLRTPESSSLFPIEPIVAHLNAKFQSAYIPRQEVCIDESLTLWKGSLSFRQYIKTKAAKFGIKTFELCESATGYLWSFFVYTGKKTAYDTSLPPSLLKGTAAVLSLIRPLLNKGYTLFTDNWFNSPLLTRYLKRNKTDVVGSLRENRQHLPPLVRHCELKAGQFAARHSGDMTVMAYHDKKKIALISTYHGTEIAQAPPKPFRSSVWKPQVVLDYNKNMGGVDLKDGMLEAYLLERKRCSKWSMKIFKRLLNCSILNARICLKAATGVHLDHIVFRLDLVQQILENNLNLVPRPRRTTKQLPEVPSFSPSCSRFTTNRHWPSTVAKRSKTGRTMRRRCAECRRQTTYECKLCNVGLCIDQCFETHHTRP